LNDIRPSAIMKEPYEEMGPDAGGEGMSAHITTDHPAIDNENVVSFVVHTISRDFETPEPLELETTYFSTVERKSAPLDCCAAPVIASITQ
jgi:hypothetical protein